MHGLLLFTLFVKLHQYSSWLHAVISASLLLCLHYGEIHTIERMGI